MDESVCHDAIMAVLSDKIDRKKMAEQLCGDSNRISAYNRCVLELLRLRDPSVPFCYKLESPSGNTMVSSHRGESYVEDVEDDIQMTREFLSEFYQIEDCPSFLCHEAMLEKEDLDFLLEIYSRAYELKHVLNGDCGRYIQESLVKYAKAIIQVCRGKKDEQSLRDALE